MGGGGEEEAAAMGVSGGESGRGTDVGEGARIGASLGDGAWDGSGVGVGDFDRSPIANEARSLSSRVLRPTGLSSRSGCGELACRREPSADGEDAPNGLWAVKDFRKLNNADSARCPVEEATTLERSKDPEPALRTCCPPSLLSASGEAS